jgi:hypothetical protein
MGRHIAEYESYEWIKILADEAFREMPFFADVVQEAGIGDSTSKGYMAVYRWWEGRKGKRRGLKQPYRDDLAEYLVERFDGRYPKQLYDEARDRIDGRFLVWLLDHAEFALTLKRCPIPRETFMAYMKARPKSFSTAKKTSLSFANRVIQRLPASK